MQKALEAAFSQAKQTGTFSYPNKSLTAVPQELINFDSLQLPSMNWWQTSPLLKIDLSNNQINVLPLELLQTNPDVFLVRLQNNKLAGFPKDFFPMENQIKSLDFSINQISRLPESLLNCSKLVELLIGNNKIDDCPSLFPLQNLEILQMNNNLLMKSPVFSGLIRLKILNLCSNKIKSLEDSCFQGLNSLEQLLIRSNGVMSIDRTFFNNTPKLIIIDLSENQLDSFEFAKEMPYLDTLLLAFNRIQILKGLNYCGNLTVLDLKNNKLTNLESNIKDLQKLKTLDLSNNDLKDLPNDLGFMPNLIRITIQGNPIKTIKPSLRDGKAEVLKQYLRGRTSEPQKYEKAQVIDRWQGLLREFCMNNELVIRDQELDSFDPRVFEVKTLKLIDFSKNKLSEIQGDFQVFKNLIVLRLNDNLFTKPPKTIAFVESLQELSFQGNKLNDFFVQTNWKNLKILDLARNLLTFIPQCVLCLETLEVLSLAYNQIEDIEPLSSSLLRNLKVLDISNNRIQSLSTIFLEQRQDLTHLNIENNEIVKLPTELGFFKGLQSLKVIGNPLKLIRREVLDRGTNEILNFLRSRHVGEPPNYQIKIKKGENKIKSNEIHEENIFENQENIKMKPSFNKRLEKNTAMEIEEEKLADNRNNLLPQGKSLQEIEKEILLLEEEIQNNYSLNNFQKTTKRKELQKLIIARNAYLNKKF